MKYADVDYNDYTAESLRKKAEKLGVSIEKRCVQRQKLQTQFIKNIVAIS